MTHPRRPRQVVTPRRPPLLPKVVTTVGLVVLATTFLSAVPALLGPISFILTWFIPVPVLDWFTAVALLILGSALQRRMRVGWAAMTFLTCVSLALFALDLVSLILTRPPGMVPLDLVAQGVNMLQLTILIVALVRTRRTYHVRMRPGNVWRALASTALIALLVLVIHPSAITGILLAQEGRPVPEIIRQFPDWAYSLLGLGWALSFLLGLATLLRSQRLAARMSVDEEAQVRRLVSTHPQDSLGYFATRRDKSVFLTEHGAVAYRPSLGVALVSGDPLGDQATWPPSTPSPATACPTG